MMVLVAWDPEFPPVPMSKGTKIVNEMTVRSSDSKMRNTVPVKLPVMKSRSSQPIRFMATEKMLLRR